MLHITFPEPTALNYYHARLLAIPVKPNTHYVAACELRCEGLEDESGRGVGIAIGDSRGYDATKSQTGSQPPTPRTASGASNPSIPDRTTWCSGTTDGSLRGWSRPRCS